MSCFSTDTKETEASMTKEQSDMLKNLLTTYGSKVGTGANVYQGDRVAGLTDLQKSTLTGANNYSNLFSTPQTTTTPMFNETGQALGGLLSGQTGAQKLTDKDTSNYFTNSIYKPAMTAFNQDTLPLIDESYAGPGFFDSARSQARVRGAQDLQNNLGQQRSDLNWNALNYNAGLDEAKAGRTQQAVNQGMEYSKLPAQQTLNNLQIAASQVQGLSDLFGFGAAEQSQEQTQLTAAMQKFMEENEITDPTVLQTILSLLDKSAYSVKNSSGSDLASTMGMLDFAGGAAKTFMGGV
jgi:hypothetical protein